MTLPQIFVDDLRKAYEVAASRSTGKDGLRFFSRRTILIEALRGISFAIPRGSVAGFIGPNGAGKSTAIKILSGVLRPTAGTVLVNGLVPYKNRERHVAGIGVIFGQRTQLWWDLSVEEGFSLLRHIYRVDRLEYQRQRDRLVQRLRLESFLAQPVRQLSLGQRMRADIAAALLHRPGILILDEPTIGLDTPTKLALRQFIREMNRELGTTVILTTHDMHDVEAVAERVIVVAKGRILSDGPFSALRLANGAEHSLEVEFASEAPDLQLPEGARLFHRAAAGLELRFDPQRVSVTALIAAVTRGYPVRDIRISQPSIEQVVSSFYELHGVAEA
jgi:ABC-2 type transport system ATP-binding protein